MTTPVSLDDRRRFLLRALRLGGAGVATVGLGAYLSRRSARPREKAPLGAVKDHAVAPDASKPDLVVVQGAEPRTLVQRGLAEAGGISRFVARGEVVLIKPNIAWDRSPEQAATTNPEIVAELVRLCRGAGAGSVIVTDVPCNDAESCFARSGIAEAARAAGADVIYPHPRLFRQVDIKGQVLGAWPVLEPFLIADKIINVPIAKHHSLTGVTLGMKNWYGMIGGDRNRLHQRIHESIADLSAFARPTLTVLDGYRVLVRSGPTGGSVADVVEKKTVIVSTDQVAVDAYVAKAWWNLDAGRLRFLQLAHQRGIGRADFAALRVQMVSL